MNVLTVAIGAIRFNMAVVAWRASDTDAHTGVLLQKLGGMRHLDAMTI